MKTIRWGIIGCGDVTEIKSGPGFYKAEHSALVAVMRRQGNLAADYARRHGVARWHDDADAILGAPDIDAVYVATLPDTHHDYVVRCAAAGKPVYVEKPMAMNPGQCAGMIDACRAAGVPLWVGYYRRALPRFLKVRDLLDQGAIGDVRMVQSRQMQRPPAMPPAEDASASWRDDPARSGGGLFFDMGCHTLDFLDFLFGPITDVHGCAANRGRRSTAEDLVVASYRFASGVMGSGTWCYCADHDDETNEIIGSRGRLLFSSTRPEPIRLIRDGKSEVFPIGDPPHVHQPLIQTIVDELNGRGHCPSTGATAARTASVIDAILHEFQSERQAAAKQAVQRTG
jgi:1,5-anhydro-D-fructose reductase (1,5-anhydro-D-mannitol-forming)